MGGAWNATTWSPFLSISTRTWCSLTGGRQAPAGNDRNRSRQARAPALLDRGIAAHSQPSFVIEGVYQGIDTIVIMYRNQDDHLVNEVLRFNDDVVIEGTERISFLRNREECAVVARAWPQQFRATKTSGISRSGPTSATPRSPLVGTPSTRTSDLKWATCRGARLTTASTNRFFTSSTVYRSVICALDLRVCQLAEIDP